jgi:hypothetical protein
MVKLIGEGVKERKEIKFKEAVGAEQSITHILILSVYVCFA